MRKQNKKKTFGMNHTFYSRPLKSKIHMPVKEESIPKESVRELTRKV